MKQFLKKASRLAKINYLLVRTSGKSLICGFHRINETDNSLLGQRIERMSPTSFDEILVYLKSVGYSFSSLDDLISGDDCTRKVVITFDDGFRSVFTQAFPILRKHKAPFTVFMTTSTVDADRLLWLHRIYAAADSLCPSVIKTTISNFCHTASIQPSYNKICSDLFDHMSPDILLELSERLVIEAGLSRSEEIDIADRLYLRSEEIRQMLKNGMTIGAHGHEHWSMNTLDRSQTDNEIQLCKEMIECFCGITPRFYSPAFGKVNPFLLNSVKLANFEAICTTDDGLISCDTDPYSLPRIMVGDSPLNFTSALTKSYLNGVS